MIFTYAGIPLAIGTVTDVYLVAIAVMHSQIFAGVAAGVAAAAFIGLWGVLPSRLRL